MDKEELGGGWSSALRLYESSKTLKVVEHEWKNGRERNTFVSRECGFRISWPNGWSINWRLSDFYKKQLFTGGGDIKIPVILLPDSLIGGFRPAVVVSYEEGIKDDVGSYIHRRIRLGEADLVEVIRSLSVDLGVAMGFFHLRPFKGPSHERVFRFHKVALSADRAYIVTAMHIAENALQRHEKLREDIEAVLGSFSIVNF
ncbi:MAG: hypothetical protein QXX77_05605 [Candidatus Methanosuratincola sp.]|jgi:hypothetical protein